MGRMKKNLSKYFLYKKVEKLEMLYEKYLLKLLFIRPNVSKAIRAIEIPKVKYVFSSSI